MSYSVETCIRIRQHLADSRHLIAQAHTQIAAEYAQSVADAEAKYHTALTAPTAIIRARLDTVQARLAEQSHTAQTTKQTRRDSLHTLEERVTEQEQALAALIAKPHIRAGVRRAATQKYTFAPSLVSTDISLLETLIDERINETAKDVALLQNLVKPLFTRSSTALYVLALIVLAFTVVITRYNSAFENSKIPGIYWLYVLAPQPPAFIGLILIIVGILVWHKISTGKLSKTGIGVVIYLFLMLSLRLLLASTTEDNSYHKATYGDNTHVYYI